MVNSLDEVLAHAETIVIGNGDPEFKGILDRIENGQVVVDFVRIMDGVSQEGHYDGICW